MNKECPFCEDLELHGINAREIVDRRLADSRFIFAQSKHFNATADLYPVLDDPYFLITPRDHYNNFRDIERKEEMADIMQYLQTITGKPSVVSFEHGETEDGKKVQSVYHAHTHCIYTDRDYLSPAMGILKGLGFNPKAITFKEPYVNGEAPREGSYYTFRQGENGIVIPEGEIEIPSQFFRVVMEEIEKPDTPYPNWKDLHEDEARLMEQRLQNLPLGELV